MVILRFFQDGGCPLSSICDVCVRTTREGHLVVFTTVQNLDIWLESMHYFDNMHVFRFRDLGLTPIHVPKLLFWVFDR